MISIVQAQRTIRVHTRMRDGTLGLFEVPVTPQQGFGHAIAFAKLEPGVVNALALVS